MQILTLTTDFGAKDYYVGKFKGYLLRKTTDLLLVDISHEVSAFNTIQGAFILRHCFRDYPLGTIHILSVNNFYKEGNPRLLAIYHQGHYFIGADNGQFSLLLEGALPDKCYELSWENLEHCANPTEALFEIYANAVHHLQQGLSMESIGIPNNWIMQKITWQPVIGKDFIRAVVVHIDQYENVILNVSKETFDRVGQGRDFQLFYRSFDPITKISKHYAEAEIGDVLCMFNTAGLLEIAIYLDKAASLLGLHLQELVQIQFIN